MPLYTIWRHVDPSLTDVELEALLSRAIGSTAIYPGVLWQRSYQWDGGDQLHSLCVYEAPSIAAIEQHLRRCAVPFSETREVTEVFAEDHVPPQLNQPPPGSALFVITRTMPPGTTAAELDAAIFRSASCMGGVPGMPIPGAAVGLCLAPERQRREPTCFGPLSTAMATIATL